jgi:hypothetical protein
MSGVRPSRTLETTAFVGCKETPLVKYLEGPHMIDVTCASFPDRVPGNYGLRAGVGTGDSSRVVLLIPSLGIND